MKDPMSYVIPKMPGEIKKLKIVIRQINIATKLKVFLVLNHKCAQITLISATNALIYTINALRFQSDFVKIFVIKVM